MAVDQSARGFAARQRGTDGAQQDTQHATTTPQTTVAALSRNIAEQLEAAKNQALVKLPAPKAGDHAPQTRRQAIVKQMLRYELFANSGRFLSRVRDVPAALDERSHVQGHPFKWLVMPMAPQTIQLVAPAGDARAAEMAQRLTREIDTPEGKVTVALIPLHWQEAITLQKLHPDLLVVDDGEVFQTASPRSVLFGGEANEAPQLVEGIDDFAVKMHLSDVTYQRMGGYDGSRALNKNDCLMANVFSDLTRELGKKIPGMEVQGEDITIAATIPGSDGPLEIGAILRALPQDVSVPGFALFSPTKERLTHVKELPGPLRARGDAADDHVLAADAMKFLRSKNPGLSKEDAFVRLFGTPILDVVFGLYAQGATLELHPQNFSLRFDRNSGDVEKVVVRDLHGINYSKAWREEHGLPDICSADALRKRFPGISKADIDAWFMRPNPWTGAAELRERYQFPAAFNSSFDLYLSVFFYQSLVSLEECGYMTRGEVDRAMIKLRDAVEQSAANAGFDLSQLDEKAGSDLPREFSPTMKVPFRHGIRGRILFRRPTDPQERAKYIAKHEAPVLARRDD